VPEAIDITMMIYWNTVPAWSLLLYLGKHFLRSTLQYICVVYTEYMCCTPYLGIPTQQGGKANEKGGKANEKGNGEQHLTTKKGFHSSTPDCIVIPD
jgi:hypothetical protein